ncbi:hypothetical protein ACLPHM_05945 [Paenalcaligenes sp. Me131]|uniref:hypothetical protein n=1 Tax=Paenalcaligenes sp. Me131 TaxID=3392636 RepID=UPI003D29C218
MSIQKMPWFRMYTDFLNDPKMISLAFEDQRHFMGILALKSDGALDQACEPDLLDRIVAQRLWIDHAVIRDVKKRLVAAGLIDADWQPLAWDKRQMRSDVDPTNAERQRRYRESQKKKAEPAAPENPEPKQESVPSGDGNALRNATVTGTDKETDADKETEVIPTSSGSGEPSSVPEPKIGFQEFWDAYPSKNNRRTAKSKCAKAWKAKNLDEIADQVLTHLEAMKKTRDWIRGYEPSSLTYLNQDRWEDGLPVESPEPSSNGGQGGSFSDQDYSKGVSDDGSF